MRFPDARHIRECAIRRVYWLWALAEMRGDGRLKPSDFGPAVNGRAPVITFGIERPELLFPCEPRERRHVRVALRHRSAA